MIWVCRAGMNSVYLDYFLKTQRIFLPWDGFKCDLRQYKNREEIKKLVREEKGDVAKTSISNWSGQLYTFCWDMSINDKVLIPHKGRRKYTFAKIVGEYTYTENDEKGLWHSRAISIVPGDIPRDIFSQSMQYSLGAYRTIFKVKDENELTRAIDNYVHRK